MATRHGRNGVDAASGFADQAEVLVHARLAGDIVGATKMDGPNGSRAPRERRGVRHAHPQHPARRARQARGRCGQSAGEQRLRRHPFGADGQDAAAISTGTTSLAGDPQWPGADTRAAPTPMPSAIPTACASTAEACCGSRPNGGPAIGKPRWLRSATRCSAPIRPAVASSASWSAHGCEITGCTVTPDRRSLFVNIQHPGEMREDGSGTPNSAWPDGSVAGSARPRSATVAVRRRDGGIVGS